MLARIQWSPERFAAAVASILDAMDMSAADLARMAGISRSQASRWARGAHQPAYPNVRQLGIAVYRKHPELAQELMAAAGYPPVTDNDLAGDPLGDLHPARDDWEAAVLADDGLSDDWKRDLITASRDARDRYAARRAARHAAQARGQAS